MVDAVIVLLGAGGATGISAITRLKPSSQALRAVDSTRYWSRSHIILLYRYPGGVIALQICTVKRTPLTFDDFDITVVAPNAAGCCHQFSGNTLAGGGHQPAVLMLRHNRQTSQRAQKHGLTARAKFRRQLPGAINTSSAVCGPPAKGKMPSCKSTPPAQWF